MKNVIDVLKNVLCFVSGLDSRVVSMIKFHKMNPRCVAGPTLISIFLFANGRTKHLDSLKIVEYLFKLKKEIERDDEGWGKEIVINLHPVPLDCKSISFFIKEELGEISIKKIDESSLEDGVWYKINDLLL